MESGHITTTVTSKESVHPVDYEGMGRGSQTPPQGVPRASSSVPSSVPSGVVWPTDITMSLALGL